MAENCTIYCKNKNLAEVARLVRGHFPSSVANPANDEWESMVAHGTDGSIRISAKWLHERGDEFCRLLLSTGAYIDGLVSNTPAKRKEVMSHVIASQVVFGVVVEPEFDSDERYNEVVFSIANELDGIIFNGHEMLDANGETLVAAA